MHLKNIKKANVFALAVGLGLLCSCSGEPDKPKTPPLTPEMAQQLLNFDNRAETFLNRVRQKNPACEFSLTLPEQTPPMTQIDLEHIVQCQGRPAPLEFDASATFVFDAASGKWTLKRFSS